MDNKIKIIISWLFIILGAAIIFYSLFSSYNIFTGKTAVPEVFKIETQKGGGGGTGGLESGLSGIDIEKMLENQLKGMLPENTIPKTLNLAAWSIFAWIMIMAGGQIAGIGIKLVKSN